MLTLSSHLFPSPMLKPSPGLLLLCSLVFPTPCSHTTGCAQSLHPSLQHITLRVREEATVFQTTAIKSFHVLHFLLFIPPTTKQSYSMISKLVFKSIATISWQQTAAFFILLIHLSKQLITDLDLLQC